MIAAGGSRRPGAVNMKLVFTEYDKGDAFARAMLAGLGQIHIAAKVLLTDVTTGRSVASFEASKTFASGRTLRRSNADRGRRSGVRSKRRGDIQEELRRREVDDSARPDLRSFRAPRSGALARPSVAPPPIHHIPQRLAALERFDLAGDGARPRWGRRSPRCGGSRRRSGASIAASPPAAARVSNTSSDAPFRTPESSAARMSASTCKPPRPALIEHRAAESSVLRASLAKSEAFDQPARLCRSEARGRRGYRCARAARRGRPCRGKHSIPAVDFGVALQPATLKPMR